MGGGAHVGVTIFFVLSGYLITSVLREKHDLAAFYVRRARRLLPALLVWVLALTLAGVITARDALPPLLYVANWAAVGGGLSTPLAHTWSLATEEQFYLLWPLVLIAMRRPVGLLVFVILAGGFLRIAMPDNEIGLIASRFDGLAWGCILGLGIVPHFPRILTLVAIVVLGAFTVAAPGDLKFLTSFGFTAIAAASFVVMAALVARPTGILARPPLMAAGRISYGLYLWHFPFAMIAQRLLYVETGGFLVPSVGQADDIVVTLVALVTTFDAAITSWYLVERHFLVQRDARSVGNGRLARVRATEAGL